MRLKKLLASTLATLVAVSAMIIPSAAADDIAEGEAFIGFGINDWSHGFWNKSDDTTTNYKEKATTAKVTGNGEYTVKLDFVGLETSREDEETGDPFPAIEEVTDVGAMALILNIDANDEANADVAIDITSVKINGTAVTLAGASFSNMEDDVFRSTINNQYASFKPDEHKSSNPDNATNFLVSNEDFVGAKNMEVTFTVSGLANDAATPDTDADTDTDTDTNTGNSGTGIESVAAIAAVALIAGGAVVISRKRK